VPSLNPSYGNPKEGRDCFLETNPSFSRDLRKRGFGEGIISSFQVSDVSYQ